MDGVVDFLDAIYYSLNAFETFFCDDYETSSGIALLLAPSHTRAKMANMMPEKPIANLPQAARALALLLASTPSVMDAPPRVLHMLMEFAHRYTAQVLSDAQIFAEHAGRPGRLTTDDVTLAIQGKVGFEFGGRVPKEVSPSLRRRTLFLSLFIYL